MRTFLAMVVGLALASAGVVLFVWLLWWLWSRREEEEVAEIEIEVGEPPSEEEPPAVGIEAEGEALAIEDEVEAEVQEAAPEPDDLKRIEGISPKISSVLQEAGITTYSLLAGIIYHSDFPEQVLYFFKELYRLNYIRAPFLTLNDVSLTGSDKTVLDAVAVTKSLMGEMDFISLPSEPDFNGIVFIPEVYEYDLARLTNELKSHGMDYQVRESSNIKILEDLVNLLFVGTDFFRGDDQFIDFKVEDIFDYNIYRFWNTCE